MVEIMRVVWGSRGCSSMAKAKRKKPHEVCVERMRVWVCVCVRSLHSRLPLKLEEELNSQNEQNSLMFLKITSIYTKKVNFMHLALIPTLPSHFTLVLCV